MYRHFPYAIHEHAKSAAIASECAGRAGHFREYHDLLFKSQDSIGVVSWVEFAKRSGIADTSGFNECMSSDEVRTVLSNDSMAAQELGVIGTPAILVNRWLIGGSPGYDRLKALVQRSLNEVPG